MVREHLLVEAR